MTAKQYTFPLSEYRLPIYERWDEKKVPCPHNPNGWVAYHYELAAESFLENYSEEQLDIADNSDII